MASAPKSFSWLALGVAAALAITSCSTAPEGLIRPGSGGDGGSGVEGDGGVGAGVAVDIPRDEVLGGLSDDDRNYLVDAGETTWDVTYKSDVEVVSGSGLDSLLSSDPTSGEYIFDRAAAEAADIDLNEGDVLLLAGHSLVRITAVSESGDQVIAATEPASLDEAIQDGTVAWDVPLAVDFDQFVKSMEAEGEVDTLSMGAGGTGVGPQLIGIGLEMPDGSVIPMAGEGDTPEAEFDSVEVFEESVEWEFMLDSNKYQFRITDRGEAIDILIVVSRYEGDEPKLAYRAEGTIGGIHSMATANYANGELEYSDIVIDDLEIDLDLSMVAAGAGEGELRATLPIPFLKYTFPVGPVPVTIKIKANITGAVQAHADGAASGTASFAYRGGVGLTFEGVSVSAEDKTLSYKMDPEPADSSASMGNNVDAQFGVAFPEISLSLFGQGLIPYIRPGFFTGSRLTWGDPAAGFAASSICKSAYVRSEVAVGYNFKVITKSLASGETFIHQDEDETFAESCPEELK